MNFIPECFATMPSVAPVQCSKNIEARAQDKAVLIMDEVDGMSGGDRGGVADLIASIKSSKVPIICICN